MTAKNPDLATRGAQRWTMAALLLSVLVIMLDNSVLNVGLPTIAAALHADTAQLQWVVTAYSVTFGGLLLTAGNLADRVGRRRGLVAGLLVMALGSLSVLVVADAGWLAVARAITGIGAAFVMPAALSLLYVSFTGDERPTAIGLFMTVSMLGFVVGPLVGGLLLEHVGWQWLFLLNVPVAAVTIPVVLARLHESAKPTAEPADLFGAALSTGAMGSLVLGLTSGPIDGWNSPKVLASAAAAIGLGSLFVAHELRVPHPVVDLRLLRSKAFAVPAVTEGVAFVGLSSVMFVSTLLIQVVQGNSPLRAGLLFLPVVAVAVVTNAPLTRLGTVLGGTRSMSVGLLLGAAGMVLVGARPGSTPWTVAGMAVFVVGMRLGMTTIALELIEALPPERTGLGSALNDTFQEVGGALGVATLGALLSQVYRDSLPPGIPEPARASVTDALTAADPRAVAAALDAFQHAASIALYAGAGLLAAVAFVVAAVRRAGER